MWSYSRKARILATFSPSSSLNSKESLVLNELPGPYVGDEATPASSQATIKTNEIYVEGLVHCRVRL